MIHSMDIIINISNWLITHKCHEIITVERLHIHRLSLSNTITYKNRDDDDDDCDQSRIITTATTKQSLLSSSSLTLSYSPCAKLLNNDSRSIFFINVSFLLMISQVFLMVNVNGKKRIHTEENLMITSLLIIVVVELVVDDRKVL